MSMMLCLKSMFESENIFDYILPANKCLTVNAACIFLETYIRFFYD